MMVDQKRKYFSGNTVEQAIMKAAAHYGVQPAELAYQVVEKKHGFLKVRRRIVIRVDPGAPAHETGTPSEPSPSPQLPVDPEAQPAAEPQPAPRTGEPERPRRRRSRRDGQSVVSLPEAPRSASEHYPRAAGDLAAAADRGLEVLLGFVGADVQWTILQAEDHLAIELSGPGQGVLLADEGRVLLAVQHLLPRAMRGLSGVSSAVRVNCDSFHEIREERLRDLAQRTASEVKRQGRARTLEPMAPDERRIVHLTLADDPEVETESRGEGYVKRVQIRPSSS